jgi:CubicO group peptidase (beta-lactamase class C family)
MLLVAAFLVVGQMVLSVSAAARTDRLPPITDSTLDDVERYLETELMDAGRPGLAAAIVHDGEIMLSVGLGEASPGVAMTADTPLFIASVSKSITAFALMQQVEAGRVDLDDPVLSYLPELEPEGGEVAVRDLLHHRSGLTRYVGNEPWRGELGSSLETNVGRLGPFLYANASFSYSNANYDALALIVERVSGTPFGDYVVDAVFTPLEMENSFVGSPQQDTRGDVADANYHWLFLGYRTFDQPSPSGLAGSAVMYSTADDLARFLMAHLGGGVYRGSRVLSEESVKQLHKAESLGIDLPEDYPVDVGYAGGLFTDASFGPEVDEDLAEMVTLWHDGSVAGYRSIIWMIPEADLGFVGLTNANNTADQSWLPQVAQGVKYLLFGMEPPDIEVSVPFLRRYTKQLMLGIVAAQLILASLTVTTLRNRVRRWINNAVMIVASIIDLTAAVTIMWLVPTVAETPLLVVVQSPDFRILILAMAAGVLWGVYRTYLFVTKRSRPAIPASE